MMCEERTAVSLFWGGRLFCVWRISSHREQKQRVSRPVPESTTRKNKSAQYPTSKTQAYSKQIGTAPHIQNPSIQTQVNILPSSTTKNSLKKARGVCRGAAALRPLCGFLFLHKKRFSHLTRCKNQNSMDGEGFEPSKAVPTDLQSAPFGHSGIHP